VDWAVFDTLILRACWHYPEQHDRFKDWIRYLAEKQIPVWNHTAIVSWNLDKRYLQEFAGRGIPIVPTVWSDGSAPPGLEKILDQNNWAEAVVKPQISTNSDNTWCVTWPTTQEDQTRVEAMSAGCSLMIQKLMPEIAEGEWSLIFIQGSFSHAVLKRPAAGQIFVQEHRGGVTLPAEAPEAMINEAGRVLSLAEELTGQPTLSARVDGLLVQDRFTLMELELIEPSLYMRHHPPTGSPKRLPE
jgi:glutathione synthase/RimK-type ligase-like ATP-grasp enzyme